MKRSLAFLLVTIGLSISGLGQTPSISTLEERLQTAPDEEQASICFDLIRAYINTDKSKSVFYADKALQISTARNDSTDIVQSLRMKAQVLRRMGNNKAALTLFTDLLERVKPIHQRNTRLHEEYKTILNGAAITNNLMGNYQEAIQGYQQFYELAYQDSDFEGVSIAYHNIGLNYQEMQNYADAKKYYLLARKIKQANGITFGLSDTEMNLAHIYNDLKQYDSSQLYMDYALSGCQEDCDVLQMNAFQVKGIALLGKRDTLAARTQLTKCLELAKKLDDSRYELHTKVLLAGIALHLNEREQAYTLLQESERMATQMPDLRSLQDIYKLYVSYYKQFPNAEMFTFYQNRFDLLSEQILSDSIQFGLKILEKEFQLNEYFKLLSFQRKVIDQQNKINVGYILLIILSALLIVLLFNNVRIHRRVNAQLSEARATIQQKNEQLAHQNENLDRDIASKTLGLERANRILETINEELDSFITNTTQEFQQPVAELSALYTQGSQLALPSECEQLWQGLKPPLTAIQTCLQQLDFIKQDKFRSITIESLNLNTLLGDLIGSIHSRNLLPAKIQLQWDKDEQALLYADRQLVVLILESLLLNAISFYNPAPDINSFIAIKAVRSKDRLKLSVTDNGIGVRVQQPERQFQVFNLYTSQRRLSEVSVYLVKTSADRLGARLGLEITTEGYTQFTVDFPIGNPGGSREN